ncbi:MAG: sialidase family protein, partial [Acidimicrobiales bacterium]
MAMALGLPCVALVRPASAEPGQAAPAPAGFRVGANAVFGASSTPGVNTDPLRGLDIPAFAVDPANPSHIVLVDENFLTAQCEYHVTFDGGRTWSGGRLTTPADFAQPPCNTFDSGGYAHDDQSVVFGSGNNVYTTFASHRGLQERPETHVIQGEGDSVMVAHSSDGGRTFQTATVAIQGGPGPQPYVIRPGIAVAPGTGGDKLLVAGWRVYVTSGGASSGGGERSLVTATSSDGGATWSGPVLANAPGELVREPTQPVIGPDGTYYVGWRDRNAAPAVNHIVVASSTDGGATWAQSAAGEAAAAGVTSGGGFPRLAVDPRNGALYVVYQSATAAGTSIVLQRSTDRAATWSAPVTVNDDPAGTGVPHDAPAVFVAPDGRVDVLWLDLRNSYPTPAAAKASGVADIYWADSTDGGSTFPANRRITDRSIDMNAGLIGRIGSYTWYGAAEAPTGN